MAASTMTGTAGMSASRRRGGGAGDTISAPEVKSGVDFRVPTVATVQDLAAEA